MKDVSVQMSSNNFLNPNSPFHCDNLMYQQNLRCFFYADKVTCNTSKATRSETKKLTFSLVVMKFCNTMLRATPAIPTQTSFRLQINAFFGRKKSFCFSTKRLCFVACWSSFTLRWNKRVRSNSEATLFWNSFSKSVWSGKPTQCRHAQPISIKKSCPLDYKSTLG